MDTIFNIISAIFNIASVIFTVIGTIVALLYVWRDIKKRQQPIKREEVREVAFRGVIILFVVLLIASGVGAGWSILRQTTQPRTTAITLQDEFLRDIGGAQKLFEDPLSENGHGSYVWDEGTKAEGSCMFEGRYHALAIASSQSGLSCLLKKNFSDRNLALQVETRVIEGSQAALVFRWANLPHNLYAYYYFYINIDDGSYGLIKSKNIPLYEGIDNAQVISKGKNQLNKIAIKAVDDSICFYVNGRSLKCVTDSSSYGPGTIGFSSGSGPSNVEYSDAEVWNL